MKRSIIQYKFRVYFMVDSVLESIYMTVNSTDISTGAKLLANTMLTPEQQEQLFSIVPISSKCI